MDDWTFVESRFDDLGNQLETAKQHIVKVPLDFITRYRVWKDQVVRDRLLRLRKDPRLETAIRFYDLTLRDYIRLYQRAAKEFSVVADNVNTTQQALEHIQLQYEDRTDRLLEVHNSFLKELIDIINNEV